MELKDVKAYLKIDEDITDDDKVLTQFNVAAEGYITKAIGDTAFKSNKQLSETAMLLLIESWYRPNDVDMKKYCNCINSILRTLSIANG